MKILFTDLDDTLIKTKTGSVFPRGSWDWRLIPGIVDAIKRYSPDHIHIVSNQSRLGKREGAWLMKVGQVIKAIQDSYGPGAPQITYDYCTSSKSSGDLRRKPGPGMILEFLDRLPDTELPECLMIGDASGKPGDFSDSDREAAKNAGIPYLDVNEFLETVWD